MPGIRPRARERDVQSSGKGKMSKRSFSQSVVSLETPFGLFEVSATVGGESVKFEMPARWTVKQLLNYRKDGACHVVFGDSGSRPAEGHGRRKLDSTGTDGFEASNTNLGDVILRIPLPGDGSGWYLERIGASRRRGWRVEGNLEQLNPS